MIFDCDGVLVDSEKWSCSAWLPVLARRGIRAELSEIEAFIGKSDQAVIDHFQEKNGIEFSAEIIAERQQEYFELARGRLESFSGLKDLLDELQCRNVPVAVASSGKHEKVRFSLAQVELDGFFQIICSSTEVERGKPAPDLFLLTADRLGVEPGDCAVVEDSVFGIRAALDARMLALGFASSHPPPILRQAGADHVFTSYPELLSLLDTLF